MRIGLCVACILVCVACSSNEDPVPVDCPPKCPASKGADTLGRQPAANPIPAENALAGDPKWNKGGSATHGELDMFLSTEAAGAGETVAGKVYSAQPVTLDVKVYRLGWYGGAGARLVWQGPPAPASSQPTCPMDPVTGLLSCPWSDTFTFTVGKDWVSGLYVAKVTRPDGVMRMAPLVVRDARAAELLFVSGSNTSEAYNRWGNVSLYYDGTGTLKKGRAYAVSYDRPYQQQNGAGQMLYWEAPLAQFLEKNGYDVTYGTNPEFVRFKDELQGIGMMVHGGHDEYWPTAEREQIDRWVAANHFSLAYFGANPAYWRVRMEPGNGKANRTIVCYKDDASKDPQPNTTIRFRDEPNANPEDALYGEGYESYEIVPFPLVVKDPSHWMFAGTGLTQGQLLPGLLGYEFDRVVSDSTTPKNLAITMESPNVTATGMPDLGHVVAREHAGGTIVFDGGSIYFPLAVSSDPDVHDDRVARLILNVIEKGLTHRRAPRDLGTVGTQVPSVPAPVGAWATSVTNLAGNGAGFADGPGASAKFNAPTGLAALPDGSVVVADTGNSSIRLIGNDPAHTVSTIAGDGSPGDRDGAGNIARFRQPTGVAVGPDGAIYVADQLNDTIRRIARAGSGWQVSTFAGSARAAADVNGPVATARFNRPSALAFDATGTLYVTDEGNEKIKSIAAGVVSTVAGSGALGDQDGPAATSAFNDPSAIAVNGGSVFFLDAANGRVRRLDTASGTVSTIAGTSARAIGFADGSGDDARFRAQLGLAADATGNLFLADSANYRLRMIVPGASSSATRVSSVAGSGLMGDRLGTGDATDLVVPTGVAVRPDGTIVVTDSGHSAIRVVQR